LTELLSLRDSLLLQSRVSPHPETRIHARRSGLTWHPWHPWLTGSAARSKHSGWVAQRRHPTSSLNPREQLAEDPLRLGGDLSVVGLLELRAGHRPEIIP
jgi:hypothetical protein